MCQYNIYHDVTKHDIFDKLIMFQKTVILIPNVIVLSLWGGLILFSNTLTGFTYYMIAALTFEV